MALIVRIDVDRAYGKQPQYRHVLSRLSSDFYFPKLESLGYLKELIWMLETLNEHRAKSYAFFRRCTLPSPTVMNLLREGGHEVGLHLENSRSFESFCEEKNLLEQHVGKSVSAVSKHGSGGARYGFHHYAPYEPEKYMTWARDSGMKVFLGNLEDPTLEPQRSQEIPLTFPSAFWLEPHWRDTGKFSIEWLVSRAKEHDTVLLVHPENVVESPQLTAAFVHLIRSLPTTLLS